MRQHRRVIWFTHVAPACGQERGAAARRRLAGRRKNAIANSLQKILGASTAMFSNSATGKSWPVQSPGSGDQPYALVRGRQLRWQNGKAPA
jgi:hypothetical protein